MLKNNLVTALNLLAKQTKVVLLLLVESVRESQYFSQTKNHPATQMLSPSKNGHGERKELLLLLPLRNSPQFYCLF